MTFSMHFNDKGAKKYLDGLDSAGVIKILRKGLTKGGGVYAAAIKAEAPVKKRGGSAGSYAVKSRRSGAVTQKAYGQPGEMKGSVKVRRIHTNPAVGVVVGPMGKKAFMRYWVTQGTKAHRIPKAGGFARLLTPFGIFESIHHPGAKANPFVSRGGSRAESAAYSVAIATIQAEAAK